MIDDPHRPLPKRAPDWQTWVILLGLVVVLPLACLFVGIVKFLAWWKVAFVL